MPRCMTRCADEATVDTPSDGRLHEDRPLLKHRHSIGFAARHARHVAKTIAKKSRAASGEIRRRAGRLVHNTPMNVATPSRSRPSAGSSDWRDERSSSFDDEFEDDCFEIGSDDDEEEAFGMHQLSDSKGPLTDALSTWGRPGESPEKACRLERTPEKVCGLRPLGLSGIEKANGPKTFYMGTPRDCS
eukprot:CAMPEP_0169128326 /NCGR_PEP_ID=MMETSP1015-20121227/36504_1 /TAXON_ID=342587 /ORGANISM="Karlodinium micrum, Strain CCMP2283" /LENGTH=187 /DNA_ID=CAMNT_0009192213 /DNA_START=203 /DNA_END=766 /DNA_ORIENTATION=-